MPKHVELHISAILPDSEDELGHEAVLATRDGANAVIEAWKALGILDAKRSCRLIRGKDKPPATAEPATAEPAPVTLQPAA